jgi:probable HAF family extracellular repeat protein
MRSLGTLGAVGGQGSGATSVNTHLRVVGTSATADGNQLAFIWTPGGGMQPLPTLGGNFGGAEDINEFGVIVGQSLTAKGAQRAAIWRPTTGPAAVASMDEGTAPEVVASPSESQDARAALCALGRELGDWSRAGRIASRACLAP